MLALQNRQSETLAGVRAEIHGSFYVE
jgi:hypothetical protein